LEGVNLRDRLIAYRADRGWSQARLVEESGVSGATIAHIETGANKRPRRITLMRLAQAFGVSLDDFLSDGPPKAPQAPEIPPLQLEVMYAEDDEATRRRVLEAASEAEREAYLAELDRALGRTEHALLEDAASAASTLDEDERLAYTGRRNVLRRYIGRLVALRDEATGERAAPPTVEQVEEALHA